MNICIIKNDVLTFKNLITPIISQLGGRLNVLNRNRHPMTWIMWMQTKNTARLHHLRTGGSNACLIFLLSNVQEICANGTNFLVKLYILSTCKYVTLIPTTCLWVFIGLKYIIGLQKPPGFEDFITGEIFKNFRLDPYVRHYVFTHSLIAVPLWVNREASADVDGET